MKSDTKQIESKLEPLASSVNRDLSSSLSSSAPTKEVFISPQKLSTQRGKISREFKAEKRVFCLSKSTEGTFLRMKTRKTARDAYVRAEITTSLAHQIRAIRMQRGWTQVELAEKIGTKQGVVSRLEDPSYGRVSLNTLFDLSSAFDVGLDVKFISLVAMLDQTFEPNVGSREVSAFEDEVDAVSFYSKISVDGYITALSNANLSQPLIQNSLTVIPSTSRYLVTEQTL